MLEEEDHHPPTDDTDINYLALVDPETNQYQLNGNYNVLRSYRTLSYGNVVIEYNGRLKTLETLKSPQGQRLLKDLAVEVISVGKLLPSTIKYSYMIVDEDNTIPEDDSNYSWVLRNNDTTCSRTCYGEITLTPVCIRTNEHQQVVHPSKCPQNELKPHRITCNTHCKLQWEITSYTPCQSESGLCESQGERLAQYSCIKIHENGQRERVHDSECESKPPERESCILNTNCWKINIWSECSVTCGNGWQTRDFTCEGDCITFKPSQERRQCSNSDICPNWRFGDWTPCTVTCGTEEGWKTRSIECTLNGFPVSTSLCSPDSLPVAPRESCRSLVSCYKWLPLEWQACTVTCGRSPGVQRRNIECVAVSDSRSVSSALCLDKERPESVRACESKVACPIPPHLDETDEDNMILPTLNDNSYIGKCFYLYLLLIYIDYTL